MIRSKKNNSFPPIRSAIERSGMSVVQVARKSGIHVDTFCKWRTGHSLPSLRLLRKLAKALQLKVEDLL